MYGSSESCETSINTRKKRKIKALKGSVAYNSRLGNNIPNLSQNSGRLKALPKEPEISYVARLLGEDPPIENS